MPRLRTVTLVFAALLGSAPALAASYPVSDRWTYDYSSETGPAKQCNPPHMEFRGARRFDTGGGVPDYRIVSVTRLGPARFQLVDEFNTGQINARLDYTLRLIDADHIEIALASGATLRLRRCA